eukprot:TRINITY_DN33570_c0_g1_i1.p3 TRINITY_DN33570_c0_g1~~TRINITY_DN33570_c0_g1_i1.p3  ORF type:complete len:104 (-),score=13.70 TRINITY_DN33570_c0_g1_i1:279-590(-)
MVHCRGEIHSYRSAMEQVEAKLGLTIQGRLDSWGHMQQRESGANARKKDKAKANKTPVRAVAWALAFPAYICRIGLSVNLGQSFFQLLCISASRARQKGARQD